jgi:hypothetical protein
LVGGAQRRPLILRPSARFLPAVRHGARGQNEVRAKDFFGYDLFSKKVIISCDFFRL